MLKKLYTKAKSKKLYIFYFIFFINGYIFINYSWHRLFVKVKKIEITPIKEDILPIKPIKKRSSSNCFVIIKDKK